MLPFHLRSGGHVLPVQEKREENVDNSPENRGETGRNGGYVEKRGDTGMYGSNFEHDQNLPHSPPFSILDGENGIETGAVREQRNGNGTRTG